MATHHNLPSICKYCRHYFFKGRRGGICQKLEVPVQANWEACSLADYPFLPTGKYWKQLHDRKFLLMSAGNIAIRIQL